MAGRGRKGQEDVRSTGRGPGSRVPPDRTGRVVYTTESLTSDVGGAAREAGSLERAILQLRRAVARISSDPRRASAATPSEVRARAVEGVEGQGERLPHLDAIQRSFGRHDVRHTRVHRDERATHAARDIGAEAYTVGDEVAFAGRPSLRTAAHEAAHVVQQRSGRTPAGGVGREGDAWERHADRVADQVVRGESAEDLLDAKAGSGAGGGALAVQREPVRVVAAATPVFDAPDDSGNVIAEVMADTLFERTGVEGDFTVIRYRGVQAYVRTEALDEDLEGSDAPAPHADLEEQLLRHCREGLNIGFYKDDVSDGETIRGAVQNWAEAWHGVGVDNAEVDENALAVDTGILRLGSGNRALTTQEVVSKTRAIVAAVRQLRRGVGIRSIDTPPPEDLPVKVSNLAIGVHGLRGGLQMDGLRAVSDRRARQDGAMEPDGTPSDDHDSRLNPVVAEHVQNFVDGIRGYLADDAAIHLLACNAAASPRDLDETRSRMTATDSEEDTDWNDYGVQEPRGERSVAGRMHESLVEAGVGDAMVTGHTQRGHTTRNWTVRIFGGDVAEGRPGGVDALTYIFDDAFVASEQASLSRSASPSQAADITIERVRSTMRSVYAAIGQPTGDLAGDVQVARDIMMNPEGARRSIQGFWSEIIAPTPEDFLGFRSGRHEVDSDETDPAERNRQRDLVEVRRTVIRTWQAWVETHPITPTDNVVLPIL